METVDGVLCCTGIDAVAIDNLDLTRSKGYVVPGMQGENRKEHYWPDEKEKEGSDGQTEVIPAKAPATSRVGVSNALVPLLVKS